MVRVPLVAFLAAAVLVPASARTRAPQDQAPPEPPARYSNQAVLNQMWSNNLQAGSGPIRFEYGPIRLEEMGTLAPLGMMVLDHVTPSDHMGFGPPDFTAPSDRWEVLAPGPGFVVSVTRTRLARGEDYLVIIEHSGTFYSWIGLIDHLDGSISHALPDPMPYGGWQPVRVPVAAGQVVGRYGGNHGIDFSVIDTEVTRSGFIYPEHYDYEAWKIHVVDYFDYVDEPLRSTFLAFTPRTAEPRGGKIDYDVDGTLAGNWFVEGTNWLRGVIGTPVPSATHLALSPHHIDPGKTTVSLGNFNAPSVLPSLIIWP